MNSPRQRQLMLLVVTLVIIGATALIAAARTDALASNREAWVATWASAPEPTIDPANIALAPSTLPLLKGFKNQSIREIVRTSVGGRMARIRLSNAFGYAPLKIGAVSLALPMPKAGPGDLQPDSIRQVSFNGRPTVTIPPGGATLSDPVELNVPAFGDVAVTIFLAENSGPPTMHIFARATSYIGPGNATAAASGATLSTNANHYFFLGSLDVLNRSGEGTVAVLGDSITDAIGTFSNTNTRWTNYLAARFKDDAGDRAPGVLNLGISGNRLGHNGVDAHAGDSLVHGEWGISAAARFNTDVLSQTGIKAVILELGINDIWMNHDNADLIVSEIQQLATQAHRVGVHFYVCLLSPWSGLVFGPKPVYSADLDTTRLQVNSYLRTSSDFDGYIDLDGALRDAGTPSKLSADVDSGDHIHPNAKGNELMAKAVPLDWFE
jgi:lysophospholipase L1-like esterase